MDAQELKSALKEEGNAYLLVDVRESDEVAEDPFFRSPSQHYLSLPLTILAVLPKEEIMDRLAAAARELGRELPGTKVVVACRSGNRSAMAVSFFSSHGIAAENLDGGRISFGDPL